MGLSIRWGFVARHIASGALLCACAPPALSLLGFVPLVPVAPLTLALWITTLVLALASFVSVALHYRTGAFGPPPTCALFLATVALAVAVCGLVFVGSLGAALAWPD